MNTALRSLLVLQESDDRLDAVRGVLKSAPVELAQMAERLAAREAQTTALRDAARKVEARRQALDVEASGLRARIVKYRAQQNLTRKNEEYSALLHEIEHAEREITRIEDAELELMEEYEAAKRAADADEARLREFRQGVATQEAAVRSRSDAASKRLAEAEAERQTRAAALEPAILSRYNRLREARGGRVVVPLQHGTTCGGCHMTVTHQTAIECRKLESVVSCDNCGRFLYPEDWQADAG